MTRRELAERQERKGWYCYACARWLHPGDGRAQKKRGREHYGLYCKAGCKWPA